MVSFERPDFYRPSPARCSPHLGSAGVTSKAWALRLGMLAAGAREDRESGVMDFASTAALSYLDAATPELDLLTGWRYRMGIRHQPAADLPGPPRP